MGMYLESFIIHAFLYEKQFTDFEVATVGRGGGCEMACLVQALQTFSHASAGCHKVTEGPL
jgi:hypothetical protein